MPQQAFADQQATLAALLPSDRIPVPRSFVGGDRAEPGPLTDFVRQHRGRAMDLYLLAIAAADGQHQVPKLPAVVWARALGLDPTSGEPTISRLWQWLERKDLVLASREGRSKVICLVDDGSERMPLSSAFFMGNFHNRLSTPGKALLLIAVAEGGQLAHTSDLYGLNRDTVRRGLSALGTVGLLRSQLRQVASPLSSRGYSLESTFVLLPPFAL